MELGIHPDIMKKIMRLKPLDSCICIDYIGYNDAGDVIETYEYTVELN